MRPKIIKKAIYSLRKQKIDWNYLYLFEEASCQKRMKEKIKQMHKWKYFQLLVWTLILFWYVTLVWYEKEEINISKLHKAFLNELDVFCFGLIHSDCCSNFNTETKT